jgi:GTP diphosphokinase / guanosine-3',5'-bis(diphosphate) 3'-diphosphatase
MSTLTAETINALAFAAHKHRDQRRKDAPASPHINHPITLLPEALFDQAAAGRP